MTNVKLSNDQWTKIGDFLGEDPNAYVGNEADCRRFVEAVKWMSRSGAQWRLFQVGSNTSRLAASGSIAEAKQAG